MCVSGASLLLVAVLSLNVSTGHGFDVPSEWKAYFMKLIEEFNK